MNEAPLHYRITEVRANYGGGPDKVREISVVEGPDALLRDLEACGVRRSRWTTDTGTSDQINGRYIRWESIKERKEMAEYDAPEAIAEGTQDGPGARKGKSMGVRLCSCTCGEPVSAKASFRQGHDQRLISLLATCAVDPKQLTNVLVQRLQLPTEAEDSELDIQARIDHISAGVVRSHSEALAAKFRKAAATAWDLVVKGKKGHSGPAGSHAVKTASKIKSAPVEAREERTEPVAGAAVRIKVGRHAYDATVHGMNQAGKITAVRYYTPGGHEMVKTEGQFTLVTA